MRLINNRGASSVLIILMMVVLVVFGLAALTTSLAGMRLAEKTGEWTGEYYDLEATGETTLYEIDKILNQAEKEAVEYIESKSYTEESGTLFPESVQFMISNSYLNAIPASYTDEFLSRVMEAAFYQSAIEGLENRFSDMELKYDANYLRSIIEEEKFSGVDLSITVSEKKEEFSKNLDISIRLTAPRYDFVLSNNQISGDRLPIPLKRFKVTSWREWQEYFDYSETMQFNSLSD